MRQKLTAIAVFVGLLAYAGSAFALPTYTVLAPTEVVPGDTFEVNIELNLETQPSTGSAISLRFPADLLVVESALSVLGPWQLTVAPVVDQAGGLVATMQGIALFPINADGSLPPFIVGQITFTAANAGDASLEVGFFTQSDALGGDTGEGAICNQTDPGPSGCTLVGATVNVIPEPGTLALLAIGLGTIGVAGRRS